MDKLPKTDQRRQSAIPPVVFLSDVLAHYGSFEVETDGDHEVGQAVVGSVRSEKIGFCCFLASRLKRAEILLFDVHDLNLISGLELEEIITFLQNPGKDHKYRTAIQRGRDYCVEGEATIHAINSIRKTASIRVVNKGISAEYGGKFLTLVRSIEPEKCGVVGDWCGKELELFSLERLRLKVAAGRLAAMSESDHARKIGRYTNLLVNQRPQLELKPGATELSPTYFSSDDYFYFTGKFNREGLPALWFDTADLEWPVIGTKENERHAMWKVRIKEMYKKSGKSHTDLCIELAKTLHDEKGLRDKTAAVSAATIQRITTDPGGRNRGGSKPKSLRLAK